MMNCSRRDLLMAATLAPLAVTLSAHSSTDVLRVGGRAFGTAWRASFAAGVNPTAVRQMIESVVKQIDDSMSPYRADTSLSLFNGARTTAWQTMPQDLCTVLQASLQIAQRSDGAFDPTVGPLVGQYGFGPIHQSPSGTYRDVAMRGNAVRKHVPGLALDLCGIAKGYALDRIIVGMHRLGLVDFMVELGGEVIAKGHHPHGRSWQVGIEQAAGGTTAMQRIVRLDDMALATSPDTANFYERGGRRYSHIIDPLTQQPANNGLASVSVIARQAMMADGLATALMVLGPLRGPQLAQQEKISALFIERKKDTLHETMTGRFSRWVVA